MDFARNVVPLNSLRRFDFTKRQLAILDKQLEIPKNYKLVYLQNIQRQDAYAAVKFCEQILSLSEATSHIYPGNIEPCPVSDFLVFQTSSPKWQKVSRSALPLKTIKVYSESAAFSYARRIQALLFFTESIHKDSTANLLQSLATAVLAEKTDEEKLKLVTLWASFEALLPDVSPEDTVRISYFQKYITPAVTYSYLSDNFVELYRYLRKQKGGKLINFLSKVDLDGNEVHKLAHVICSNDDVLKRELSEIFWHSPLAITKLQSIEKTYENPKSIMSYLEKHELRVKWQVERIYRERNKIVHAGEESEFLTNLIFNCYNYYTRIIDAIDRVSNKYGNLSVDKSLSAIISLRDQEHAKLKKMFEDSRKGDINMAENILSLLKEKKPHY